MGNYQARLDRIKAAIAPESMLLVFVERDETNEQAAARYATARGLPIKAVLARGIFLSWVDTLL